MAEWVLIVFISSGLGMPVASFNFEAECYEAMNKSELFNEGKATCLPIETEKPKRRQRQLTPAMAK